ncbi:MAG: hypothetical protein GX858_04195, partial [Clostridiales bacterium]|nr:hypothetical protein [Clostridiales bacterium]
AMYMLFQTGIQRAADAGREYGGLPVWQAAKVYERCPQAEQTVTMDIGAFDAWYGESYLQIGQYARSFHACQGMGGNPLPGPASAYFMMTNQGAQKIKNAGREKSFFDGLPYDFDDYAKLVQDETVQTLLITIQADYREVKAAFPKNDAVRRALNTMKNNVNKVLDAVAASKVMADEEKNDLSFLLERKLEKLDEAFTAACAVSVRLVMDDYEIVRGQEADVWVHIYQGVGETLDLTDLTLNLPEGWTITRGERKGTLGNNGSVIAHFNIKANDSAELYNAFHPNTLTATANFAQGFTVSGVPENTFALLPEFSVEMEEKKLALNTLGDLKPIKHSVKVCNLSPQHTEATVSVRVPEEWSVEPQNTKTTFAPNETKRFEFSVKPAKGVAPGAYEVGGIAHGIRENSLTVQTIDYPHIDKTFYLYEAVCTVQAFPLALDKTLRVGYISSGLDSVGETLQMLGMDITFLGEQDIRFSDLSQYHTIVTGIRAYQHIKWLKGLNEKLLAYAHDGGNLVVQYHTALDGYTPELAPYPIQV